MSTLRLDLGPLARLKERREFALEESWDPMEVGGETVIFDGPVRAQGAVERMIAGAHITGTAQARLALRCGRCLDPYVEELSVPIDLFLSETARADEDKDQAQTADELRPYREQVDLTPPIEESVVLALPVRPLCAEDCPGLCPVCGTRRDRGCECEGRDEEASVGRLGQLLLDAEREHKANRSESQGAGPSGERADRRARKESGPVTGNEQTRHASVRKGS